VDIEVCVGRAGHVEFCIGAAAEFGVFRERGGKVLSLLALLIRWQ